MLALELSIGRFKVALCGHSPLVVYIAAQCWSTNSKKYAVTVMRWSGGRLVRNADKRLTRETHWRGGVSVGGGEK